MIEPRGKVEAVRKFDTKVQSLKYSVLKEVVRLAFANELLASLPTIPKTIVPGKIPTMRCCVYKERAILNERVRIAIGGDSSNPNVIEVIDIACDECPVGGFEVTNACRGCIAHHCESVCRRGAITFDRNQKAHIDKSKCVECGLCSKVCPYSAIMNLKRPCENACKVKAISMDEDKVACIDNKKCIACGACVYQCPFGAIVDKSYILNVVDLIKKRGSDNYTLYAVVAPSISSQFSYAKLGQVVSGLKELGFSDVVEAAMGADLVASNESLELVEKGFLLSSCCPAFTSYVRQAFPQLADKISHNLSPMATIAKYIKQTDEKAKVVFIGPCTAKKLEAQDPLVSPWVDCVITFEELQALLDGAGLDITQLPEVPLDNASFYGRIFARSGGLSEAVGQALREHAVRMARQDGCEPSQEEAAMASDEEGAFKVTVGPFKDFVYKPVACDGIEECRKALLRASRPGFNGNFIEGMACVGGCIGGAGCLTHGEKDRREVDKYGRLAMEKKISDVVRMTES